MKYELAKQVTLSLLFTESEISDRPFEQLSGESVQTADDAMSEKSEMQGILSHEN